MNLYDSIIYEAIAGSGGGGGGGSASEEIAKLVTGKIENVDIVVSAKIKDYSFEKCTVLKTVKIGVTDEVFGFSIGNYVFSSCSALESVELTKPYSMGNNTFNSCSSMKSLTIKGVSSVPVASSSALTGLPADCNIYVPAEMVDDFKSASGWSARASHIQAL